MFVYKDAPVVPWQVLKIHVGTGRFTEVVPNPYVRATDQRLLVLNVGYLRLKPRITFTFNGTM